MPAGPVHAIAAGPFPHVRDRRRPGVLLGAGRRRATRHRIRPWFADDPGGRHRARRPLNGNLRQGDELDLCAGAHGASLVLGLELRRAARHDAGAALGVQRRPVAVQQPAGIRFTAISAGANHVCAIADDDNIYCWGAAGTLGTGAGQVVAQVPVRPGDRHPGARRRGHCGSRRTRSSPSPRSSGCWGSRCSSVCAWGPSNRSSSRRARCCPTYQTGDLVVSRTVAAAHPGARRRRHLARRRRAPPITHRVVGRRARRRHAGGQRRSRSRCRGTPRAQAHPRPYVVEQALVPVVRVPGMGPLIATVQRPVVAVPALVAVAALVAIAFVPSGTAPPAPVEAEPVARGRQAARVPEG